MTVESSKSRLLISRPTLLGNYIIGYTSIRTPLHVDYSFRNSLLIGNYTTTCYLNTKRRLFI